MYWTTERESEEDSASTGSSTPPTPSADRLYAPISGTSWPTLSLQSQTTKDVLQSVLKVRKSWKTLRGGETVWPLDLEAALLEGLENYQPDDSRETRMLGRFPRRNRFISDYIFEKTGKRRTAKQVGSRLQQLRESCGGKKLLHLLSPFRQPAYSDSSASSDSSCTSPVSPLTDGQSFHNPRHTVVYIDILPEGVADGARETTPPTWLDKDVVHASDHPRRLASIKPTVTFMSPVPVAGQSQFTVYSDDRIIHTENVPLTPVDNPSVTGFLYSTPLVPEYWKVILQSTDPTRFTICQEVVKGENSTIAFSATYKFSYPAQQSSGFPTPLDTLNFPDTPIRSDLDSLISAASLEQSQFEGNRYPAHVAPAWDSLPSRENSPNQGYRSPSSDSSSTCFPSELSNYVL
ncbi:hypothetical protein B0H16DRAFT_387998 [Mycena metata]|uniref:TEA domain-containing protein n=1 Tax=Mycena metata TaxID=1033252 RepID=A0AAD7JNK5_9AGAR|nr:hypothetical protein B0H16DRAFT_387998 [Mycena metata]